MSQDIPQDAHERTDKEKVFKHDQKRTSPFLTLKSRCPKLTLSSEWGRPQVQGFHMLFQYPNDRIKTSTFPHMMTDSVSWSRNSNYAQQSAMSKPQRRSRVKNYLVVFNPWPSAVWTKSKAKKHHSILQSSFCFWLALVWNYGPWRAWDKMWMVSCQVKNWKTYLITKCTRPPTIFWNLQPKSYWWNSHWWNMCANPCMFFICVHFCGRRHCFMSVY